MYTYKLFLVICVMFAAAGIKAQSKLADSKRYSEHIYVYRLNKADLEKLYREEEEISEEFLHTYVTRYSCEEEMPELPRGNYLLVQAKGSKLEYNSHTVDDLHYHFADEEQFGLYLYNGQGIPISTAWVRVGDKVAKWDAATQTYTSSSFRRAKVLEIEHEGVYHYFRLDPQQLKRPRQSLRERWWSMQSALKRRKRSKMSSYVVFNKPKYRPGETIRFKAWLASRKGAPVRKTVYVRTHKITGKDTLLSVIEPYRPGMYHGSFRLPDKLSRRIDVNYVVRLTSENSKRTYGYGSFWMEEYELKGIKLEVRSSVTQHHRQNPPTISVKVKDENDMAVADGVCTLSVVPQGNCTFHDSTGFFPAKYWSHQINMAEPGEKSVVLPDSIFPPNISFGYKVNCVYRSSDEEQHKDYLSIYYNGNSSFLRFTANDTGVIISQVTDGQTDTTTAVIHHHLQTGDVVACDTVTLPMHLRLSPTVAYYSVKTSEAQDIYRVENSGNNLLYPDFGRDRDSLWLNVENPCGYPFWYTISKGKTILEKGYTSSLRYRKKIRGDDTYDMSLTYQVGGRFRTLHRRLPARKNRVGIHVTTPSIVYPGQKTQTEVCLTDYRGRPVADADLTAYAVTTKLSKEMPLVPQWRKEKISSRKMFRYADREQKTVSMRRMLDWNRWKKEMALDSIAYYQFLHPDPLYILSERCSGNITQVAPYVTCRGELEAVYVIKIDNLPYYCHGTEHFPVYSFPVSPGRHTIRLRTFDKEVVIDGIDLPAGKKTIISVDSEKSDSLSGIVVEKVSQENVGMLSPKEQFLLSKYMLSVERNFEIQKLARSSIKIEKPMYLKSGPLCYYLNPWSTQKRTTRILNNAIFTGPFPYLDSTTLYAGSESVNGFIPEGGYDYTIRKGYLKLKQQDSLRPARKLSPYTPMPDFNARVLLRSDIERMQKNRLHELFRGGQISFTDFSVPLRPEMIEPKYHLRLHLRDTGKANTPYLILFFSKDKTIREVFSGNIRYFHWLKADSLQLVLLYTDGSYYQCPVTLKPNGLNYLSLSASPRRKGDSFSQWVDHFLSTTMLYSSDTLSVNKGIYSVPTPPTNAPQAFTTFVSGTVCSAFDGSPLPGTRITIQGTKEGATADLNGYFSLQVPDTGTIKVSMIGCETQYLPITPGLHYQIFLENSHAALEEVVVTGIFSNKKYTITGTVASVQTPRRAAKALLPVEHQEQTPLIILNSLPYAGSLESIDQSLITSIKRIAPERATELYGTQGQNGVLVITTARTSGADGEQPGRSIRRNFRDDAFWQPALRTDKEGKTTFEITYPDDLTNWKAHFIAVDRKRRTGYASALVKSFQAISSRLLIPQFAITGDTFRAIGRINNYLDDTVHARQIIRVNDERHEKTITFGASHIDHIPVNVGTGDSLTIAFSLEKTDGFTDGEERTIPVYPAGCEEHHGIFKILNDDSTRLFRLNPEAGKVTVHAETTPHELFLREIDKTILYPYLCNEQMASKLKALLMQKKIYALLNRPFREDKNITKLITRLIRNQNREELWGWWNRESTVSWISRHVTEVLLAAEAAGFRTGFEKQFATECLLSRLQNGYAQRATSPINKSEWLNMLITLRTLQTSLDSSRYLRMLDSLPSVNFYERLLSLRAKQLLGAAISKRDVMRYACHSIMGNLYWEEQKDKNQPVRFIHPEHNTAQNTLLAYEILRTTGDAEEELEKIRNYFFEIRQGGYWRNTYESSRIMETILPDLVCAEAPFAASGLEVNDKRVDSFPFTAEYAADTTLKVRKTGSLPVFFTAWQSGWNPQPKAKAQGFRINTFLCQRGDTVTQLKIGETARLIATVTADSDAEFVMIEIPIPAGCSYSNKNYYIEGRRVHKEYHKDKVMIFLPFLPKGEHDFSIELLPRYSGRFHLNPARVGLMYFPTFYGREEAKEVRSLKDF